MKLAALNHVVKSKTASLNHNLMKLAALNHVVKSKTASLNDAERRVADTDAEFAAARVVVERASTSNTTEKRVTGLKRVRSRSVKAAADAECADARVAAT